MELVIVLCIAGVVIMLIESILADIVRNAEDEEENKE